MAEHVAIKTPYITLAQLLKIENLIASGGQAKAFLASETIQVNGQDESRRGKKLYPGDNVVYDGVTYEIAALSAEEMAEEAEKEAILARFQANQKKAAPKKRSTTSKKPSKKQPKGPSSWS